LNRFHGHNLSQLGGGDIPPFNRRAPEASGRQTRNERQKKARPRLTRVFNSQKE
jgi:hypothetical protein